MKTVHKQVLDFRQGPIFHFIIPKDAKFIKFGLDPSGNMALWYEFHVGVPVVERVLEIFGTGHQIPPLSVHVETFTLGAFVWHLYDHGEILKPIGHA